MSALTALWRDLNVLVLATVRLWWRLLPQLISLYLRTGQIRYGRGWPDSGQM